MGLTFNLGRVSAIKNRAICKWTLKNDIFWYPFIFSNIENIATINIAKKIYPYIGWKVYYNYKEYHKAELKTDLSWTVKQFSLTQQKYSQFDISHLFSSI